MELDQIFDKLSQKPKVSSRLKRLSAVSLEPEEIFLDSHKDQAQKMEPPFAKRNFLIFFSLSIFLFFVLLGRVGWLQVVRGESYYSQAEKNRIQAIPILAPRGIIYDRNEEQLVYNVSSFDVVITPAYLPKNEAEREQILKSVAVILDKDYKDIKQLIRDDNSFSFEPIIIESDIEHERAVQLEVKLKNQAGASLKKTLKREYVSGPYFSHILGYVGQMNKGDVELYKDYFLTEIVGKSGLELEYENILRTPPGKRELEVDAFGNIKREVSFSESAEARGLILSIDADLQRFLYDRIKKTLTGLGLSRGAAVALDPRSGEILALVSMPSFDNNLLVQGIGQEEYLELFEDVEQPLFNRAISGNYPPGSTIKPFIGAAALEEEIVSPRQKINDKGALIVYNQYDPNVVYRFPDWKVHGLVDIYSAIAESCNVFFYHVGGGYGDLKGLGVDRIEKYLKLFGFGQLTDIDLPSEKSGFVPGAEWKEKEKGERWFVGDTYHLSIGQGDMTATPLQIAILTGAIANGGTVWEPRVADKIVDVKKNVIEDINSSGRQIDFISERNLGIIKEAMRQTVEAGSAQYLKTIPVEAAGKTGTAQTLKDKKPHAWFTSFAPFEEPEIVLTILVEEGGEGSSVSVPIARDILNWYFNR